jgi:hypothetical protein
MKDILQNPMKDRNNTLCDFFLRETSTGQKQLWVNKFLHFLFKNSCDTNLIQCGNEKEEKKRGKKFTNRYLLQKIK